MVSPFRMDRRWRPPTDSRSPCTGIVAPWWQSPWLPRALLLIPAALIVAALLNLFGQRPSTSVATGARAKLTVYAPANARSGLEYAARFRIDAGQELNHATLIFDPGWADGYTVNGLAPQPLTEASQNGKLEFGFGHIAGGDHLTFWMSLQINPTNIGRHRQDIWLDDSKSSDRPHWTERSRSTHRRDHSGHRHWGNRRLPLHHLHAPHHRPP